MREVVVVALTCLIVAMSTPPSSGRPSPLSPERDEADLDNVFKPAAVDPGTTTITTNAADATTADAAFAVAAAASLNAAPTANNVTASTGGDGGGRVSADVSGEVAALRNAGMIAALKATRKQAVPGTPSVQPLRLIHNKAFAGATPDISHILAFARDGHLLLKGALPEIRGSTLRNALDMARAQLEPKLYQHGLSAMGCPYGGRDSVDVLKQRIMQCARDKGVSPPFFQFINPHKVAPAVGLMARSSRLATVAASLLQVDSVRLYQTGVFIKDPYGVNQPTAWHRDLAMVPLDTNDYLTIWCPTSSLHSTDSALSFASRSHRDMSLGHWHLQRNRVQQQQQQQQHHQSAAGMSSTKGVQARHDNIVSYKYALGDCSVHHGWTLHSAPHTRHPLVAREAITFSFVRGDAVQLRAVRNTTRPKVGLHWAVVNDKLQLRGQETLVPREDELSYRTWFRGNGAPIVTNELPLVYKDGPKTKTLD